MGRQMDGTAPLPAVAISSDAAPVADDPPPSASGAGSAEVAPGSTERSAADMAAAASVLKQRLLDPSLPIPRRFRALFSLRNLPCPEARAALIAAMSDSSHLLAHEAAFALGQQQHADAVPALIAALKDKSRFHAIVRHEAAEALGAIGSEDCVGVLQASLTDPAQEVRETCELALRRIEEAASERGKRRGREGTAERGGAEGASESGGDGRGGGGSDREEDASELERLSPYMSVDPAVSCMFRDVPTAAVSAVLLSESAAMYDRYCAMFELRNRNTPEAVAAVVAALGSSSALLKHEVAYVLGQLQDKAATAALVAVLENEQEHPMVRHEAADALGSIADLNAKNLLLAFCNDKQPIVAESCQVALDMMAYELQPDEFEYADVNISIPSQA